MAHDHLRTDAVYRTSWSLWLIRIIADAVADGIRKPKPRHPRARTVTPVDTDFPMGLDLSNPGDMAWVSRLLAKP